MAERMGLSMSYIHQLEAGRRNASEPVQRMFGILEEQETAGMLDHPPGPSEADMHYKEAAAMLRTIPVIGWAHAGEAACYEEIPLDWQNHVPTECRDPQAFGVRLEGDSMMPDYREGDLLVVMPSTQPYSGCLVVLRLADGGVMFRRVEIRGERVRLVPINTHYGIEEFPGEQISWIYPVWGSWRQMWHG